jgi:hypothetical protein
MTDRRYRDPATRPRPWVPRRPAVGPVVGPVVALVLAGLLAPILAACAPSDGDRAATGLYRVMNSSRNPAVEQLEFGAEYGVVAASRAMVHAPQALLVLERRLGGAVEQRIVLPNATAVRGDNVLHVRAQTDTSARSQEFNFNEVAARFGGLPAPFERASPGSLMSGSDGLGSYVYARENIGVDTVCVLVMRRIGPGARPLPSGTRSLDMILRNCVVGTLDQALAPMSDRAMAVAAAPQGAIYTLSPFAAPQR